MSHNGIYIKITYNTKKEKLDLGYYWQTNKIESLYSVRINYMLKKLAELYVAEIVRLHEVSLFIIFYKDPWWH